MENTKPTTVNTTMSTNGNHTQEPVIAGTPPGALTPQPMRPDLSTLSALAALFQRWAEQSERASKDELTPELSWFLKGAAFAFGLDAQRARSLADPVGAKKPPVGDLGLGQAFEIMVGMLRSMSIAGDQEPISATTTENSSGVAA